MNDSNMMEQIYGNTLADEKNLNFSIYRKPFD